jgi:hypothetical protein
VAAATATWRARAIFLIKSFMILTLMTGIITVVISHGFMQIKRYL